jgi:catechol 2,3-dioxygenase-like lactoylglutathione lyase family enzyme
MQLLDHVSITVADISAVAPFYDAVLATLDCAQVYQREDALGYGERCRPGTPGESYLAVLQSGEAGTDARRHYCFKAQSRAQVDAFYQAALTHGGSSDGAPGLREHYHPHYYSAFVRDPHGNRLEAVCHTAP